MMMMMMMMIFALQFHVSDDAVCKLSGIEVEKNDKKFLI